MNTENLNKDKGLRLKECILDKYRSQKEFAELVTSKGLYNLTPQNLNAMINGSRTISREFAHTVAGLLDVNEQFLLCETDIRFIRDPAIDYSIPKNDNTLSTIVRLLECENNTQIYFNVISYAKSAKRKHIIDLINKYKKKTPLPYRDCDDPAMGTLLFLLSENIIPYAERLSIHKKSIEFEKANTEQRKTITYSDYSNVRKKCSIDNLFGVNTSSCLGIYKDENYTSEVIIESIEINNNLLSPAEFFSLVNISSNMIVSLFNHYDDLSPFNTMSQNLY